MDEDHTNLRKEEQQRKKTGNEKYYRQAIKFAYHKNIDRLFIRMKEKGRGKKAKKKIKNRQTRERDIHKPSTL